MTTDLTSNQIIDACGGTAQTALLCEVSPSAVSQWRAEGIPKARMKFLQLARPEIFSPTLVKKIDAKVVVAYG